MVLKNQNNGSGLTIVGNSYFNHGFLFEMLPCMNNKLPAIQHSNKSNFQDKFFSCYCTLNMVTMLNNFKIIG